VKVFLTGVTGFVGSHVARLLIEKGYAVHALIRPQSDQRRIADIVPKLHLLEGDLLSTEGIISRIRPVRPEICLHLAWYVEPGKYLAAPENIALLCSTLRLASGLAGVGCRRLLVAGTCFEYDTDFGYLSEATPTKPRSPYAAAKLAVYLVLEQWAITAGLALAWPRLFYLYGPFEDSRRLIPNVVLSLLENREVKVTPGEQVRDFLHVEDVARAVVAVVESGVTGPVNVGSGQPVSVREVASRIGRLLEKSELIRVGGLPYNPSDPRFVCADNRKLKEATGWRPRFDLEDGLGQTIEWWQSRTR